MTESNRDKARENSSQTKWNQRYANQEPEAQPCTVLHDYGYLLPAQGKALDLACGLGGNAFYMAEKGLSIDAVDISQVAIDLVNEKARQDGVPVEGKLRDVEKSGLPDSLYDVIVVSYFLHRTSFKDIISHLAPKGLLFYQTWSKEKVAAVGPSNPDFLLDKGELLRLCKGMDILFYQEEGLVGDTSNGLRGQARIIAAR